MKRNKKLLILITCTFIIAIFAVTIYYGIKFFSFFEPDTSSGTVYDKIGSTTIKYRYETTTWLNIDTHVTVTDDHGNRIYNYSIKRNFSKPEIKVWDNNESIKFYEFTTYGQDFIIYNINNRGFKAFEGDPFEGDPYISEISAADKSVIDPYIKKLFMTKRFECIETYGYYLLSNGDNDVKECLERYKDDKFTDEELEINKNSYYDENSIMSNAESDLGRYEKSLNSSSGY